jgi:hypothetical protein
LKSVQNSGPCPNFTQDNSFFWVDIFNAPRGEFLYTETALEETSPSIPQEILGSSELSEVRGVWFRDHLTHASCRAKKETDCTYADNRNDAISSSLSSIEDCNAFVVLEFLCTGRHGN